VAKATLGVGSQGDARVRSPTPSITIHQLAEADAATNASNRLLGLAEEFHYVSSMKRERVTMQDTIKKRNHSELFHDTFTPASLDFASETAPVSCALCTRAVRLSELHGQVPFNAVAEWRAKRGGRVAAEAQRNPCPLTCFPAAPFPPHDQRLDVCRRYEPAHLCVFCTQFFDKQFGDILDKRHRVCHCLHLGLPVQAQLISWLGDQQIGDERGALPHRVVVDNGVQAQNFQNEHRRGWRHAGASSTPFEVHARQATPHANHGVSARKVVCAPVSVPQITSS
jgi:hypothetical protein